MRISDWSSDVCSSDLAADRELGHRLGHAEQHVGPGDREACAAGEFRNVVARRDREDFRAAPAPRRHPPQRLRLRAKQGDAWHVRIGDAIARSPDKIAARHRDWRSNRSHGVAGTGAYSTSLPPHPGTTPRLNPARDRAAHGHRPKDFACRLTMTASWPPPRRSEEHTSELQSLMRISYAVFCLKKQKKPS